MMLVLHPFDIYHPALQFAIEQENGIKDVSFRDTMTIRETDNELFSTGTWS